MLCLFLTPPLDGPATGGTLYNRQLLAALAGSPELTFEQQSFGHQLPAADQVWVDSLYLADMPSLRARTPTSLRIGLLLHYLPSLLDKPELQSLADLSEREQRALEAADMIVTPSEYLRELVLKLYPGKPCVCVTPGVHMTPPRADVDIRDRSALMICNVTENKGVLPFLRALARSVPPSAAFRLSIAGDLQLQAAYASGCIELCKGHPWLSEHVTFLGSLDQHVLFEHLAKASVLVSASRMESYGMALAEARAAGTPILAIPGGNVANHIAADSGGQLTPNLHELATALCQLMSDPRELTARKSRARSAATSRPWSAAAHDFITAALSG